LDEHGRLPASGQEAREGPVFICSSSPVERYEIPLTAVKEMLLGLQVGP
jgi:hypothetical protein